MRAHQQAPIEQVAVRQKAAGIVQWLGKYPPFDQMERVHCEYLVDHCVMRFYEADEVVLQANQPDGQGLYIVRSGRVTSASENEAEYEAGELFPIADLLHSDRSLVAYTAAEDTFCLFLPQQACAHLLRLSLPFRDFCLQGTSSLISTVFQSAQAQAKAYLGGSYTLDVSLKDLSSRELLSCALDTPVQTVVSHMHDFQVSSMVVVNDRQHLLGIFTLRDLRRLVASGQYFPQQAVGELMTPDPLILQEDNSAFDAALLMAEHHIGHICLVRGPKVVGVVSERDIFSLQRVDLVHLSRAIRHANDLKTLQQLQSEIDRLVNAMLAHGAKAEQLTRVITQLNDHTVNRLIELQLQRENLQDITFSWLVFGSEARGEQTRFTDQDNGIVFQAETPEQTQQYRTRLTAFALRINKALDACGLQWCPGNIMASNPELCLSEKEWTQRFQSIVERPAPEQLLQSTIYFDCRSVWGSEQALVRLRRRLLALVQDQPVFQRLMAQAAIDRRIPSGRMPTRLASLIGPGHHTVDIKTQAMAPLVDCLRILALSHGYAEPGTLDRLAFLRDTGIIDKEQARSYKESYRYLQLLRLQLHQTQKKAGAALSNIVQLDSLNQLDARVLRESLRQVRHLLRDLALRYRL